MKEYIPILKKSQLFSSISEDEIEGMLKCLGARMKKFRKNDYVIRQGENISDILLVVKGMLHIQKDDYWGNRTILNSIGVGEMLGEAYAAPGSGAILNDAVAVEDSVVFFFDARRIITTCPSACHFHASVVRNLFFAISEKNRKLVGKLGHMSKRTTREKLISYLSEEADRSGSDTFTIPFNRQQLADFLCVDRSAMSNELCKMRDEGLIEFHKSSFRLIDCTD